MFERTRQIAKVEKFEKKHGNTSAAKKAEGALKAELTSLLTKYLAEMNADSVVIEVAYNDVADFLTIISSDAMSDYEYTQLTETLYEFKVKELTW